MTTKLGVTVALDPDTNVVTIRPDGRLTPQNLQHLVAVFHRAQQLLPRFVVHIDATALRKNPGITCSTLTSQEVQPPLVSPTVRRGDKERAA